MLRFKDGVTFDTDGEYRVEHRSDGYYVVGKGLLIPVKDREAGTIMVAKLKGKENKK